MFELKRPSVWFLAACFMIYSFQFLSINAFLPIMLEEKTTLASDTIVRWTALVLFVNAFGNIAGGWLIGRGVRSDYVLIASALICGLVALIAYADDTVAWVRIGSAIAFSAVGGLVPGAAWAIVSVVAKSAASVGLLVAVLLQGMAFGQLLGPIALPAVVEGSSGNWMAGGYMMLLVSFIGAAFAYLFGRRMALR